MHHFVESITNLKGDALVGYYVKLIDTSTLDAIDIFSDDNGTPISSTSDVDNMAVVNSDGNVDLWVDPGQYHLDIYASDATTFVERIESLPFGLNTITLASGSAVSTIAALEGISSPAVGQAAILTHQTRGGNFVFDDSDLSAEVTADTAQGIYIAPSSDTTGASGAWVRKFEGPVQLGWFADRTGATDAAAGLLAAVAVAVPLAITTTPLKQIAISDGQFKISSEVNLTGENVRLIGAGGTIVPSRGTAGGKVIKTLSGILEVIGVEFDGGASQPTTASGTTWIIQCGSAVADSVSRVVIRDCKFKNCNAVGSTDVASNLIVTHAIYLQGVTDAIIENNTCDTISGAAVFAKIITRLRMVGNRWSGTQWYTANLDSGITHGLIEGNYFNCSLATGVYKGGAVNTVNDYGDAQNTFIEIKNNYFTGYYSYGGVIRCQSDKAVLIEGNVIGPCQLGNTNSADGDQITAIRVVTRGYLAPNPTSSNPPDTVAIRNNVAMSGFGQDNFIPGQRPFIYVSNDWDGSPTPARNAISSVIIEGNVCRSPSSTSCFSHGVILHGLIGGIENVRIFDNDVQVYLTSTTPLGGGIGLVATNSTGLIDRVQIGGNKVNNLQTAAGSTQTCLQIWQNVDNVRNVRPNTLIGGFRGVRTEASAGPTLEALDNQIFVSNTTDKSFGTAQSRPAFSGYGTGAVGYATGVGGSVVQATSKSTGVTLNTLCGNISMNAANLVAGTKVSFTLTNSTIAAGDLLILNHTSGGTIGSYVLNARASAAGSIIIDVTNRSAGDLAEAVVIKFAVFKGVTS